MFRWIYLKLKITELESRKNDLEHQLLKLEAKFEERKALSSDWEKLYDEKKATIVSLLEVLKSKG